MVVLPLLVAEPVTVGAWLPVIVGPLAGPLRGPERGPVDAGPLVVPVGVDAAGVDAAGVVDEGPAGGRVGPDEPALIICIA